jgi:hypothetical protein
MKLIIHGIVLSFLVLFVFSCRNSNTQKNTNQQQLNNHPKTTNSEKEEVWTVERCYRENPYDFDTLLKNGYHLHFEYFKRDKNAYVESQLTLMRGQKTIDTLNEMGYGIVMKNLGYIGADFNDCFAFVQAYGSGNPLEMQLIRKSDASQLVQGFMIDSDEKNELLLYYKDTDSLMLYDINRKTDKLLTNLKTCDYITCSLSQLYGDLKIKKVTPNVVEIEILQANNKSIRKKFVR